MANQTPYAALSPSSMEFMALLEKQLAQSQEFSSPQGAGPDRQPVYTTSTYGSNQLGVSNQQLQLGKQQPQQNANVAATLDEFGMTPEMVQAFVQGLAAAGLRSGQQLNGFNQAYPPGYNPAVIRPSQLATHLSSSSNHSPASTNTSGGPSMPDAHRQTSGSSLSSVGAYDQQDSSQGQQTDGVNRSGRRGSNKNTTPLDHSKRKAEGEELTGHERLRRHLDEEDLSSDDNQHAGPATSKRGATKDGSSARRKSTAGAAGQDDPDREAKALKRKNQNKAAQKAFRERREQRVKDLEDKVAELEANNAGQTFENENLKQLLSKLQKENMVLKESKFTFNMPFPGVQAPNLPHSLHDDKPPSPPLSLVNSRGNDGSPSISPAASGSQSRSPNGSGNAAIQPGHPLDLSPPLTMSDSSASPFSGTGGFNSNSMDQTFNPEPYNAFVNPGPFVSNVNGVSPFISVPNELALLTDAELQALLKTFKQQYTASPAVPPPQQAAAALPQFSIYRDNNPVLPDENDNADPLDVGFTGDLSINDIFGNEGNIDAFLKSLQGEASDADNINAIPGPSPHSSDTSASLGSDMYAQYFKGFTGTPDAFARTEDGTLGRSGPGSASGASASADNAFSPSNFFTMSPEADRVNDDSGPAPGVTAERIGIDEMIDCPFQGKTDWEKVQIQDDDGKLVNSKDLWSTLQHKVDMTNGFDLDDLCETFKSKAVCNGSGPVITCRDVTTIVEEYSNRIKNRS